VKNDPAVVVPIQQLQSVAASIAKHKQVSAERIAAHFITHNSSQAIERVMQVDRGRMKVDLHDRRQVQHAATSSRMTRITWRSGRSSIAVGTRSRTSPSRISMHMEWSESETTCTGRKAGVPFFDCVGTERELPANFFFQLKNAAGVSFSLRQNSLIEQPDRRHRANRSRQR